ncbi:hypothetical protein [Pseudomonas taiwanensis]|uniref:hypothetical protein n=1 Tax=Pseudomonas taiwanensis TaxID=470150 RepID=UPI0021181166|nr:hypothetical protein [Pseudomonas taiwanensis]
MKIDTQSPPASRDVARRTRRARRAFVMCSPKNGFVEIRMESWLEQSCAQVLERDPRVRWYRANPFTLDLSTGAILEKKPLRKPQGAVYYTPDFVAGVDHLQVAIEVKPAAWVEEHAALFQQVREVLLAKGMRFIVVTDEHFSAAYLRNVQLLNQYQAQAFDALPGWSTEVEAVLQTSQPMPVRELLQGLEPANHYLAAAVLSGVLRFDMQRDLFERMDFEVQPAFGSLSEFEVLRFD